MKTLALIDKHFMICSGLNLILQQHFSDMKVVSARNLIEYKTLNEDEPAILVHGISETNRQKSTTIIKKCKDYYPDIPLIVYEDNYTNKTAQYLKLGVAGLILKENNVSVLIKCIETVLSGKHYLCPAASESFINYLAGNHNPIQTTTNQVNKIIQSTALTSTEAEIAKYLTLGKSTSWISNRLDKRPSTISTIKRKIYLKTRVDNIVDLAKAIQEQEDQVTSI